MILRTPHSALRTSHGSSLSFLCRHASSSLPTHRVLAANSLNNFYLEGFCEAAMKLCKVMETKFRGDSLPALEHDLSAGSFGPHAIGVYDPASPGSNVCGALNLPVTAPVPPLPAPVVPNAVPSTP